MPSCASASPRRGPDFGWLSEETADTSERLGKRAVFVIDPIDGTRAFMSRLEDWTISLAVVLDGRPIAGVVAEPVPGRVYAAAYGLGATLNGTTLAMRAPEAIRGLTMAGPKPMTDLIVRHGATLIPKIHSLALRIARVGGGDLDAAFVGGRSRDWDLAAADLIVQEAGGLLANMKGQPPVYNSADSAHAALIAAAHPLHGPLRDLARN